MKSAVLIAAMLSGLCAEAVAAPMSEQPRPVPATLEDVFTRPTIERDLGFLAGSAGETLRELSQHPGYGQCLLRRPAKA